MGMDAEIFACGRFRPEIADCLEYKADAYDGVLPSTAVFSHLFCCNTCDSSWELARCFGIDPWDFNQHEVTIEQVMPHLSDLRELAERLEGGVQDIDHMRRLSSAGFKFYYMPNG